MIIKLLIQLKLIGNNTNKLIDFHNFFFDYKSIDEFDWCLMSEIVMIPAGDYVVKWI